MNLAEPWELDRYFASSRIVWGSDGMAVCTVEDRGGGTPEVARVIQAAPELLEALTNLVRLFHGYQGAQFVAARDAIVKATGKDPIPDVHRQGGAP